tara:strand:+ start:6219 stop:7001 length:783 start_codon:yes stop_codon:yes gene_type:complete
MAIQSNASTEEVVGGIKTYSGLTNVTVKAVNPTMAELHAMEINVKQEPSYTVEFSGESYNKVVFWLGNTDGNFKLEILMQNKPKVSQNGKNQWMNSIGQSTWSEDAPSYDWWKSAGQRKAFTGEETLINFTKAWANVASGDEVYFDTIADIANGNLSEVKALVSSLGTNEVRVLIGVKDDKYQQVYTKYFGRVKPQRDDLFIKSLNDDYGSFNADFNADLKWGTHVATATLVSPDTIKEEDDWTAKPVTNGTATNEDLPF